MKPPLATSESTASVPLHQKKGSGLSWLRGGIVFLGGMLLLVMMATTIVDVIGRYIFNSPLSGAGELTELILVSVIFMGLLKQSPLRPNTPRLICSPPGCRNGPSGGGRWQSVFSAASC